MLTKSGSITVTGTITDPSLAVFVNGVRAKVNPDGTWIATNVPISLGGTAVFNATAIPTNQIPQNNTTTPAHTNSPVNPYLQNPSSTNNNSSIKSVEMKPFIQIKIYP